MRKYLIYGALFLCMGLLLSSCSKDDDPKASELAGTWKVKEHNPQKGQYAMNVVWEAPNDVTLEMMGQKFPANGLSAYLTPMMSTLIKNALKDVTLTTDGKVKSTVFKKKSKEWVTVDGYVTYKDEGNGRLRLFFDVDKTLEGSSLDAQSLTQIKAALKNGVPMRYTINGNSARFYFDTETIKSMRAYLPIIFSMAGNMPSNVLESLKTGLPNVIEKSTKIEFAVNMER